MRRVRPIPDTHPQFSVLDLPGYREYRVENWHLARDGSGRIIRGTSYPLWLSILSLCMSIAWLKVTNLLGLVCQKISSQNYSDHRLAFGNFLIGYHLSWHQ
jgi:hypothetical protein